MDKSRRWQKVKEVGLKRFTPERGGMYDVFHIQRYPADFLSYCVQAITLLPEYVIPSCIGIVTFAHFRDGVPYSLIYSQQTGIYVACVVSGRASLSVGLECRLFVRCQWVCVNMTAAHYPISVRGMPFTLTVKSSISFQSWSATLFRARLLP